MDARHEPCQTPEQAIVITVLGPEICYTAKTRHRAGRGLAVETTDPLPIGAALKIEAGDSILLGEAVFCRREANGYFVGIVLEQRLTGLHQLRKALEEFGPAPETNPAHSTGRREGSSRPS